MSNILKLTIPIPPSINNDYMKPRGILKYKMVGGKKVPYAMAMMYEMSEAKKFKKSVIKLIKEEIIKQDFKFEIEPHFVIVEWTFFFPRTNMDTNNYYKCFVDSITETIDKEGKGPIWKDDNVSMMVDKDIYYDSVNPRVEILIYASDRVGIFENKEDYKIFINTYCSQCAKFEKIGQKGGCSIYKNAMESRIQDDLTIDFETGSKKCLKQKVIK